VNTIGNRIGAALAAALLLALPTPATPAADRQAPDQDEGEYTVSLDGRVVAREQFEYGSLGDSLQLAAAYRQPQGRDTLVVSTMALVTRSDFDLRHYVSEARFKGELRTRGVGLGDTVFTAYREGWGRGDGLTRVRPPGRLFVLQSDCFALYDLIGRSLAKRSFETWPLNVFFMGEMDTLLQATARHLGTAPLTHGGRTVQARRLEISLGETTFLTWHGPKGELLRLEQPDYKLRVVRRAPAAKPATSSAAKAPVTKPAPKP
jgi:hypothetical protein